MCQNKNNMDIWNITASDSFRVGKGDLHTVRNCYIKLESASIFFCRQGHARLGINLEEYKIVPHAQVVILPGSIVHVIEASDDLSVFFIDVSVALFKEVVARMNPYFLRFLKENPCVVLPGELIRRISGLGEAMEYIYNDRDNCFRSQIAKNHIQSFLMDIYDKTQRLFMQEQPENIGRKKELLQRFIQLIHENCTVRREVTFYAGELCITPRYLSTIVQSLTNTTAKGIIDERVILEIKALLKSTDLTVQEISNKLHFPNQSFFGRYFKKHTGMSPLEYRNIPAV